MSIPKSAKIEPSPSFWSAVTLGSVLCVGLIVLFGTTAAQDQAPMTDGETNSQPEQRSADEDNLTLNSSPNVKNDPEKMKKVTLLLAAVGGIAILGIGSIAAIMLWARHVRRLARDFGPQQKTVGNDFWFLKPPKPTASESDIADGHRPPHSPADPETPE